jgi:hypothetical protein
MVNKAQLLTADPAGIARYAIAAGPAPTVHQARYQSDQPRTTAEVIST